MTHADIHRAAVLTQAQDALDRLLASYKAVLARKVVRDATETIAEAEAALKALEQM